MAGKEGERLYGELTPDRQRKQAPQGEASKSPERQPLPSVWDVLERRAQLLESARARREQRYSSKENRAFNKEFGKKKELLGNELATLHTLGPARERLIIDIYTTLSQTSTKSFHWSSDISSQKIRQFIAKIQPMSDEELAGELHQVREALERKTKTYEKMLETRHQNSWERHKSEPVQPKQVIPDHPKE